MNQPDQPEPSFFSRIRALDGLRGMAVLLVIIAHTDGRLEQTPGGVTKLVSSVFQSGWIGVDLFFVLSGFLITGILYDSKHGRNYFRNFYARRALRILPLYYGVLVFSFWVLPRLGLLTQLMPPPPPETKATLLTFTYNIPAALYLKFASLHIFWSLAVEEHFYLLWPLVVLFLRHSALSRLCIVLIVSSFLLRVCLTSTDLPLQASYLLTPCRLDGLCAGALVALGLRSPVAWDRAIKLCSPVCLCSGLFIVGLALGQRHFLDYVDFRFNSAGAVDSRMTLTVGLTALAIFFASLMCLIISAGESYPVRRVFENRVLRSVGKYSFGMYVFHAFVIAAFWSAMFHFRTPIELHQSFPFRVGMSILVASTSWAVAFCSYHFFEKHFLALKRYFPLNPPVARRVVTQ